MVKIKEFNRTNLKVLHKKAADALKEVADKFGVQVELGLGRFSPQEFRAKVTFNAVPDGDYEPKMVRDFKAFCWKWGMTKDDLGKEFTTWRGETYEIVGGRPRATKNPIVARRLDGKEFIFSAREVKHLLERDKAKT